MNMTPGANAPVPAQPLTVRVVSGAAVDASAFRLFANGKVQGDADMVFYGQKQNDDRTIALSNEGNNTLFNIDITRLQPGVEKVAFTVTCDSVPTIAGLQRLSIQVEASNEVLLVGNVELTGRQEAALILGELYRRNGEWKFRFIAQGFNGGLKPLAEHFGVDVADDPASSPAFRQPSSPSTVAPISWAMATTWRVTSTL